MVRILCLSERQSSSFMTVQVHQRPTHYVPVQFNHIGIFHTQQDLHDLCPWVAATPIESPGQVIPCAQRQQCTRRLLALQNVLGSCQSSQYPTKRPVPSTNQNTELADIFECIEARYWTPLGQIKHLVWIEVTSERWEKLHPLVSPTLPIDEHQQRLLIHFNDLRLQSGGPDITSHR